MGKHRDMLFDYTGRFFGDRDTTTASWPPGDRVPATLGGILDYLQGTYFQFATANIAAGLAGEKYYEYDYGFGPTRARTQRRLNAARLHVQDELLRLGADSNGDIQKLFAGRGILEHYLA